MNKRYWLILTLTILVAGGVGYFFGRYPTFEGLSFQQKILTLSTDQPQKNLLPMIVPFYSMSGYMLKIETVSPGTPVLPSDIYIFCDATLFPARETLASVKAYQSLLYDDFRSLVEKIDFRIPIGWKPITTTENHTELKICSLAIHKNREKEVADLMLLLEPLSLHEWFKNNDYNATLNYFESPQFPKERRPSALRSFSLVNIQIPGY